MLKETHEKYLRIAKSVGKLSKCAKYKVGTVIVKNKTIVSTGVNGTPKGFTNCCDHFHDKDMTNPDIRIEHKNWSAIYETHSEVNAIINAKRDLTDATLYCTLEPCFNCLKTIISSGIKEIYFDTYYKRQLDTPEAHEYINKLGIKIERIKL
jgi:dCMP deaminase